MLSCYSTTTNSRSGFHAALLGVELRSSSSAPNSNQRPKPATRLQAIKKPLIIPFFKVPNHSQPVCGGVPALQSDPLLMRRGGKWHGTITTNTHTSTQQAHVFTWLVPVFTFTCVHEDTSCFQRLKEFYFVSFTCPWLTSYIRLCLVSCSLTVEFSFTSLKLALCSLLHET